MRDFIQLKGVLWHVYPVFYWVLLLVFFIDLSCMKPVWRDCHNLSGHSSTDRPRVDITMSGILTKTRFLWFSLTLITNMKSVFEWRKWLTRYKLRQFWVFCLRLFINTVSRFYQICIKYFYISSIRHYIKKLLGNKKQNLQIQKLL